MRFQYLNVYQKYNVVIGVLFLNSLAKFIVRKKFYRF